MQKNDTLYGVRKNSGVYFNQNLPCPPWKREKAKFSARVPRCFRGKKFFPSSCVLNSATLRLKRRGAFSLLHAAICASIGVCSDFCFLSGWSYQQSSRFTPRKLPTSSSFWWMTWGGGIRASTQEMGKNRPLHPRFKRRHWKKWRVSGHSSGDTTQRHRYAPRQEPLSSPECTKGMRR